MIERKDELKCTSFDNKNPVWTCNEYFIDGSSTCAFTVCYHFVTDQMMIDYPKEDKGRISRRNVQKGTQCSLIKLQLLMLVFLYCRVAIIFFFNKYVFVHPIQQIQ